MKRLIIYHRVDFDGIFSCCIAKKYFVLNGGESDIFGYNYGDPIPEYLLSTYDEIIMVDLSFPPSTMLEYQKELGDRFIWIDHHDTAIKSSEVYGYSGCTGIRTIGTAACVLTWKFFFGNEEVPYIIDLLGSYDVWNKTKYSWDQEALPLQSALRTEYGGVSMRRIWPAFDSLISIKRDDAGGLMEKGRYLCKYNRERYKSAVSKFGFPITVASKYRGIAILGTDFTSIVFGSVEETYDIYCVANRRENSEGATIYTLSLYSEPGRVDLNLGQYLRDRFGESAGGHQCAAGAEISFQDFFRLITEQVI